MNAGYARASPAAMSKVLHPERNIAHHVRFISDRVRAHVFRHNGASGRLILCAPPGHAKSDTVSIHVPLWFMDIFPKKHVVLASNTAMLATKWSRIIRNTIDSNPETFLSRVSDDSSAVDLWHTTEGGSLRAVGVGGLLSGFRAHILITDDPIASPAQARSKVQRDNLWHWYDEVADTRCWPDATQIVMHTRWNQDDLVGRLKQQEKEIKRQGLPCRPWEVINLPAIAEEGDVLGRAPGEALWPEKYPLAHLEMEKAKGSQRWASLFQQRPSPAGGAIFRREHFRYFREHDTYYELIVPDSDPKQILKSECWIGQTVDTALKAKTVNDPTACLTFAVTPENDILDLEVVTARLEVPDQLPFLYRQRDKWSPRWMAVEDKASGTGLIQRAARDGRPFKILKAEGDKVSRAHTLVVMYENGKVYHREGAQWLADTESELLSFPNGTHDDVVDVKSYAALQMATPGPRIRTL